MKNLFLFLFLLIGCNANKCLENSAIYSRLKEKFTVDDKLIAKASKEEVAEYKRDMDFKEKLFSKICKSLENNKRMLFIDDLSIAWGTKRYGLVYLYETDEVFSFEENKSSIEVRAGYNNNVELKKILGIVKPNFYDQANKLKEYFEKKSMSDVPYLSLTLIDLNRNKNADSTIGFGFGGVMNEEFDKV